MPSFTKTDMMLLLGIAAGIVVYYKAVKPQIDPYI
jgi:hypothetical protein